MTGLPDSLVVVRGLEYSRIDPTGRRVGSLGVVDFEVHTGECIVIGGQSGAGKSTFLGLVAGLLPGWGGEASGTITIAGKSVTELSAADRPELIGFLQQDISGQFFHETVAETCDFVPENLGWSQSRIDLARSEALERFGIAHLSALSPQALSGGEQVMVLIASLWMVRPKLILLDEPLSSLDPGNIASLVSALAYLKAEGCTLLICEHHYESLAAITDRWFKIDDGTLTESKPSQGTLPDYLDTQARSRDGVGPGIIALSDLSFGRGDRILGAGLSLTIRSGEILVLQGPNGVGKSTLLWTIAGLLPPLVGRVAMEGSVRLVGQNPWDQFCRAQVRAEAELDLKIRRKFRRSQILGEPQAILVKAGLWQDSERSPFLLSEGGKRRLAVVCGILSGSDVLLLDEPTAGLDYDSTLEIARLIIEYADRGGTVVCSSHDKRFLAFLGGRTLQLSPLIGSVAKRMPGKIPAVRNNFDPRTGLVGFLAAMWIAVQPTPVAVSALALMALGMSYIPGGQIRTLITFARNLVLFWLFPSLVLLLFIGPQEALEGLLRLSLLTILFHRYSITVNGKRLSVALTKWGIPYAVGFAMGAARTLVPTLSQKLTAISDILLLRLTPYRNKPWHITSVSRTRPRLPSPRVVAALLIPTIVQIWQLATQLGMNLELRGFRGLVPPNDCFKMGWKDALAIVAAVAIAVFAPMVFKQR